MFGLIAVRKVFENSIKRHLRVTLKNASFSAAAVNTSTDGRFMIVDKKTGASASDKHKYPLIWLRDNCQCSECFHAQSKSRTIDWTKFDFKNAQPKAISVNIFFLKSILIHQNKRVYLINRMFG